MARATDVRVAAARLYFLPVQTRVPLKFGSETLTRVTCARVCVRVSDGQGRTAEGWGETPLSVQWVWPSRLPYEPRRARLKAFCARLAEAWVGFGGSGHPLEIGHNFAEQVLPSLLGEANGGPAAAMVQDLTNPMLAQIPHVRLAAHVGTIMGVETNGMQFYPSASAAEAAVHPGLYRRCEGMLDLRSLAGPGFGYRLGEIRRALPAPAVECGT